MYPSSYAKHSYQSVTAKPFDLANSFASANVNDCPPVPIIFTYPKALLVSSMLRALVWAEAAPRGMKYMGSILDLMSYSSIPYNRKVLMNESVAAGRDGASCMSTTRAFFSMACVTMVYKSSVNSSRILKIS